MATIDKIPVEVAYATPEKQLIIPLQVDLGCTIEQAIHLSKMLEIFPSINLIEQKVGIFGVIKPLTETLAADDRVEIYRPLMMDPKEARRKRSLSSR